MGASMRVWIRRAAVVVVLQVVVAIPLLRAAVADVEPRRESASYNLSLGAFRRVVELGSPDYTKTFHVDVVVHLEGLETRDAALRADALRPRLRDAVRAEVARLDASDMGTLRGRERLKIQVKRAIAAILATDDVREVLFEKYALE